VTTPKPATPAPAAKPINAKCPVSGHDIDAEFTFSHDGKLVGFCCEDCRDKFKAEPAKFVAKLSANAPQTAAPAPAPKAAADPAKDAGLLKPTAAVESWRLEQHETGKGTIESKDGAIIFTVTEPGSQDWHVQAFQTPLDLKDGTQYILTFKAKATEPRAARVQAGIDEEDWHYVGLDEQIDLTKDWKDYSYTFTATDTRPNKNRLGFVLGMEKGTVQIKDLKLTAK
jgi:YHS domain-containing protein